MQKNQLANSDILTITDGVVDCENLAIWTIPINFVKQNLHRSLWKRLVKKYKFTKKDSEDDDKENIESVINKCAKVIVGTVNFSKEDTDAYSAALLMSRKFFTTLKEKSPKIQRILLEAGVEIYEKPDVRDEKKLDININLEIGKLYFYNINEMAIVFQYERRLTRLVAILDRVVRS